MKVYITGITGFIGQRLAEHLLSLSAGYIIVGCGRGPRPSFSFPIDYYQIKDWRSEDLFKSLSGCEVVFHCAGKAGAWGDFQHFYHANVEMTKLLLEASKRAKIKRFIHLSSPSMYFQLKDQRNLKEEDIPKTFFDAYGETKYLSEKLVNEYHCEEFQTVSLRPRGVIGAGDNNWFPRIIDLYHSRKLIRPGKGENQVDFTSVLNLVDFMEKLIHVPKKFMGQSYNVSNDSPVSLWEFIESGLKLMGENPKLKTLPQGLLMFLSRLSEFFAKLFGRSEEPKLLPLKIGVASYSMTLNIEKAKAAGYQAKQTNFEALEEFARWYSAR